MHANLETLLQSLSDKCEPMLYTHTHHTFSLHPRPLRPWLQLGLPPRGEGVARHEGRGRRHPQTCQKGGGELATAWLRCGQPMPRVQDEEGAVAGSSVAVTNADDGSVIETTLREFVDSLADRLPVLEQPFLARVAEVSRTCGCE